MDSEKYSMKLSNFSSKIHSRFVIVIIIAVSIFFFNCSELYMSSWNCTEQGGRECEQYGETKLLVEKPVDVLIVLDNSSDAKELNPQITLNLSQFLKCIKPADWRVGLISGTEGGKQNKFGELINLEIKGQVSDKKFVHPNIRGYKKAFSETISLRSGCSYPPYCGGNSLKPLSSIKAFMQKRENSLDGFLRDYASLAVIIVSLSDEKDGWFSGQDTTSKEVLTTLYNEYEEDQLVGLTVTDAGNKKDCITTAGEVISRGVDFLSEAGTIYGLITLDPIVMLTSQFVSYFSNKQTTKDESEIPEIVKFAKNTGGYAFDICKPAFGKALAYSVLQKIKMEERFPNECKQVQQRKNEELATLTK